jgi:hypothetical protein
VSAGLGSEGQDQCHEGATRGDRVGKQGEADITAAEPLGHDAGADHGDEQKGRRDKLDESLAD